MKSHRLPTIRFITVVFIVIIFILCFVFGFLLGSNFNQAINELKVEFVSNIDSSLDLATANKQQMVESLSREPNATHLWSWRFADQDYFHLARFLPCQTVEYTGGLESARMNSCDHSSSNEFSIPNILQAQEWLYKHQHPADCSNKRFAIIHSFSSSGFGSTVHQIASAFGKALADNRIAVYKTPGNWVRKIQRMISSYRENSFEVLPSESD